MRPVAIVRLVLLGCLFLALTSRPTHAQPDSASPFAPSACWFDIPPGETIQCGYVAVPEQPDQPDSPTIRLGVARIRSHSPRPAPDPLLVVAGGPGNSAVAYTYALHQFAALLATRDVILYDQRGVGWSQPALDCPDYTAALQAADLGDEQALALLKACQQSWTERGVTLAAYTTEASAGDIQAIRQALGYEAINLLATSYGTLVAQAALRDQPQGIRSVILDSPLPLTARIAADAPTHTAQALARLFAACAADSLCHAAYPTPAQHFYTLLDQLARESVTLTGTDPITGQPFTFLFDAEAFGGMVLGMPARAVPAFVYDIAEGEFGEVIAAREAQRRQIAAGRGTVSWAMSFAVICSEYALFVPPSAWTGNLAREATFVWNPLEQFLCRDKVIPSPRPAESDIPTLLLVGEYDYRLPFEYAQVIRRTLRHSVAYEVPGAGHSVLAAGQPCASALTLAFITNPTREPDSPCLETTAHSLLDTRFVLRGTVARGPTQAAVLLLTLLLVGGTVTLCRVHPPATHGITLTWWASLRAVGGVASALPLALVGAGWVLGGEGEPTWLLALLVPIAAATQAAFLFSPEDEPALEVLMATPRPLAWVVLERFLALLLMQGGGALVVSALLALVGRGDLSLIVAQWLPPLLCLSGLALFLTLATRRALMSLLSIGLLWAAFVALGDVLVTRWPFLWPLHLYLEPREFGYTLNRLLMGLTGATAVVASLWLLRDEERLLLGERRTRQRSVLPEPSTGKAGVLPVMSVRPERLAQLAAMVCYEGLLLWRRRVSPVLLIGLLTTPIIGLLVAQEKFSGYRAALAAGALPPDLVRSLVTAEMLPPLWIGSALLLILLLPLLAADAIPRDCQVGVKELWETLPVPPAAYLGGKLLGVWVSLLGVLGMAALGAGALWWLEVGPFHLAAFIELWTVGIAALALLNAALALLLAAKQPTSRRALLVGIAFSLVCLLGLLAAFSTPRTLFHLLNPARTALLLYYLLGWPGSSLPLDAAQLALVHEVASREEALASLGIGAVQAALLWLWAWRTTGDRG